MSARDTSGSAPQHSHPHNNRMSRNEKFWVDQVTVPHPPPPGNDKGWGTTRGGGGYDGPTRQCGSRDVCGDELILIPGNAVGTAVLLPTHQGWIQSPPRPPDDKMTIPKCWPTKVQCSHSPGSLLSETQDKALDVDHYCNPKNNVNSAFHVLFDAFPKNAFHFSLILRAA